MQAAEKDNKKKLEKTRKAYRKYQNILILKFNLPITAKLLSDCSLCKRQELHRIFWKVINTSIFLMIEWIFLVWSISIATTSQSKIKSLVLKKYGEQLFTVVVV